MLILRTNRRRPRNETAIHCVLSARAHGRPCGRPPRPWAPRAPANSTPKPSQETVPITVSRTPAGHPDEPSECPKTPARHAKIKFVYRGRYFCVPNWCTNLCTNLCTVTKIFVYQFVYRDKDFCVPVCYQFVYWAFKPKGPAEKRPRLLFCLKNFLCTNFFVFVGKGVMSCVA